MAYVLVSTFGVRTNIVGPAMESTLQNDDVNESGDITDIIIEIAKNRKCVSKGAEVDYSKAAALVIDDFRSGKLGKITLEIPNSQE